MDSSARWMRACALSLALLACRGEDPRRAAPPVARVELELRAPDSRGPAWGWPLPFSELSAGRWRSRQPVKGGGELGVEFACERAANVAVRARIGALELGVVALAFSGEGPLVARFTLPQDAAGELALELDGAAEGGVSLTGARLAPLLPAELAAAQAGRADALIALNFGGETREARVLPPGWRALGRARAGAAGSKLAVGTAPLEGAADLALVVRMRSSSEARAEWRIALPPKPRWSESVFDLPCAAGEDFELSFELEGRPESAQFAALCTPLVYAPQAEPATVLLVTSDTHRGDHVEGASRAAPLETPTLRALAARGVFFSDAYSTSNVTVPSHVALLTGFDPRDSGVTDNRARLSDDSRTLAECFQREGWRTIAVTSVSLLSPSQSNVGQGFDSVLWTPQVRGAEQSVELALRALGAAPDRPTFLWVHLFDAHGPYQPPAPFDRAFYPRDRDPRDPGRSPEPGMRVPPYLPGVRDAEYVRALYRGEIGYLDAALARLLDAPRVRSGVVALTGDHGEELGLHGIWWAHKDLYPDTLHVPLILTWPGAPAGSRVEAPVRNSDVGRTLLDLAGLERVEFPGRSLAAAAPPHSGARFALGGGRSESSINSDGWHLILQLGVPDGDSDGPARELHEIALYRLSDDPGCTRDVSADEPARAKQLRAQLVAWLAGWRGERLVGKRWDDARSLADLAALGYASDPASSPSGAALIDPDCACAQCARWR